MAFHDWNRDGKKNMQDSFIEYNIFKNSTEDNGSSPSGSETGAGCLGVILTVGILLFIISAFSKCTTPTCTVSGCDEKRVENSSYCFTHDFSNRHYGSPTYYKDAQYNRDKEKSRPEDEKPIPPEDDIKEENSADIPSSKSDSYDNHIPDTSSSSEDDPYNVNDYTDPEDFYDDNYDDFWDYDEAEEYYEEHYDD